MIDRDIVTELNRIHHRATDMRARERQLADAGENDPASDAWKIAAILAASAESEFKSALVEAWPSLAALLREAGEGWRPIESAQKSEALVIQDMSAAYELADLVLRMQMGTSTGQAARQLARQVLGTTAGTTPIRAFDTNGTLRIIPADEPVFLIRGQDVAGGDAVRAWADLAEAAGAAPDILAIARDHAAKMDAWPRKKVADLPATGGKDGE